ncbi:SET domain-containing protein [Metschnikowia bicuspidata var. bicuspidata NRRL YB-4993]|uniref:SET domain-containing protein n=1 Tax=Metschnikowia bicuspidata var. bicuspidata NRRL YB-4993 TaxID=869754 RepID=A0A1A0H9C0_9ASCO|nr:SET domain-containing protein [Metschnikowia bicuspidata var. bicuspidata NRRL YB-4993]OBA20616.1 SET domain-containing protein [Metschnikowia bicuspidata var. bicuspidata NRRL YB-4993]
MKNIDEKIDALLSWMGSDGTDSLKSNSHVSAKLEVKDVPGSGRGLYAKAPISRNERLIRILPSYLLNFSTVLAHILKHNPNEQIPASVPQNLHVPVGKKDAVGDIYAGLSLETLLALSSFQIISLFLVLEKSRGSDSFWKPFIDMLPPIEELNLCPLVWKILDLPHADRLWAMLPRSARKHSDSVLARFEKDLLVVQSLLQETALFSIQTFLWAWMCINSRCLYMEIPQAKDSADNLTMAPYVDFLNHLSEDQCGIKIDTLGFQVFTSTGYQSGEELYFSYGAHSNEFLMCEYGFTLGQNKWNYVDITHFISLLFNPKQAQFLKAKGYHGDYTLNIDGMSFRCEVALATLQEQDPETSRRLNSFVEGTTDGSYYERQSNKLLNRILAKLIADCNARLNADHALDHAAQPQIEKIRSLYQDMKQICESAQANHPAV